MLISLPYVERSGTPLSPGACIGDRGPHSDGTCSGDELYPLVVKLQSEPSLAAKMTGMILEMDNEHLLDMVFNPALLAEQVRI